MGGITGATDTTVDAVRDAVARIAADHFTTDADGAITDAIGTTLRSIGRSELEALLVPFNQASGPFLSHIKKSGDIFVPRTIARFRSGQNIRPLNFFFIYIFIRKSYGDYLNLTEEEVAMASGGPIVSAVRTVFNHTRPALVADAERFQGQYEIIRPYPYDPTQYLSGRLLIGQGTAGEQKLKPFDCALDYSYAKAGAEVPFSLNGKIVMHGHSATLFMSDEHKAHFIFYVDHRDSRRPAENMAGIVLADTGGKDLASAWPFHARLLPPGEEPRLGVLASDNIDPALMRHLRRGHVEWEPTRMPR